MSKSGKKYAEVAKLVDPNKEYSLEEAAALIQKVNYAKFNASVDIDIRLGVDPRHADQMVRGTVSLPHGTGKTVRVLALVNAAKQNEATAAGADHVGLEDYIAKMENEGWMDIDVIIATPDVMGKLGKLGKMLGPRGLMPNPKSGTVTMDVAKAVKEVKAGKIDFRVDKYGIIHTAVAKVQFSPDQIRDNALAFLQTVVKLKPSSAKGIYVKSVYMSTTMSPGLRINASSFAAQ